MDQIAPLIDGNAWRDMLGYALSSYFVVLVASTLLGAVIWSKSRGRVGTFIIVTGTLFTLFLVSFFILLYLMFAEWRLQNQFPEDVVILMALGISVFIMLIPVLPLRILLADYVSPLETEYNNLPANMMTPIDHARREYMAKKNRNKF